MTVFKFQTRTDLHNLIMWLCGHLISLEVCWALLSSLPFWELWGAPSLWDSRSFAQQIVWGHWAVCVCVNVHVGRTGQGPVLLACVPPWWALPGVWLGTNLAVQMGCKFSLRNYGMEGLAPFKKTTLLIYIVMCWQAVLQMVRCLLCVVASSLLQEVLVCM